MSRAAPSDAEIHDHLVAAVLDHRLLPGTKLVEDKLGQVYGVSRTRIRQVLIRLAQAQVVTLSPNRGASIAQPGVDEAREVFEVRRLIEPTLIARAVERASPADLTALAAQIEEEVQARLHGQQAAALRLSGEFHLHLAKLAGHSTLARLLQELVSRTSLVLMTYGSPAPAGNQPAPPMRWVDACNCHDHRGLLAAMHRRTQYRRCPAPDAATPGRPGSRPVLQPARARQHRPGDLAGGPARAMIP